VIPWLFKAMGVAANGPTAMPLFDQPTTYGCRYRLENVGPVCQAMAFSAEDDTSAFGSSRLAVKTARGARRHGYTRSGALGRVVGGTMWPSGERPEPVPQFESPRRIVR
jgi:hypothetical protein